MRWIGASIFLASLFAGVQLANDPHRANATSSVDWQSPRLYFPDTGQTLGGPFLQRWSTEYRDLGFGEPITPAIHVGGSIIQWFEFGKIEHPDDTIEPANSSDVLRAPIGQQYATKMGYFRWVPAFKPIEASGSETRYFYETRHSLANDFKRIYEQKGNEQRLGPPISQEFKLGNVQYQFFMYGALSWDQQNGTQLVPLGQLDATLHGYGNAVDDYQPGDIHYASPSMLSFSDAFPGEKQIEINLTTHELIAWVGDLELLRTKVVTGPTEAPTPTGTFSIYIKHEIQNLSGIGWNGQPYSAPATPWVMYFYLDFGIHGSTWRDTYGYGAGQGCVIPPNEAAEELWKWADFGTTVWVHR